MPSATRYLEPVADIRLLAEGREIGDAVPSHSCSRCIRHDVPTRSPVSGALPSCAAHEASAQPSIAAQHARSADRRQWPPARAAGRSPLRRRNVAASLGESSHASGAPQVGRGQPRGDDRSRRRTARQPHVAHANVLVSDLFRGRAPENVLNERVALHHASTAVTSKAYTHMLKGADRAAVDQHAATVLGAWLIEKELKSPPRTLLNVQRAEPEMNRTLGCRTTRG